MKAAVVWLILGLGICPVTFGAQRTRIGDAGNTPNPSVLPPQIITSTVPSYTSAALVNRIEGTVTLEAESGIDGSMRILRVVRSIGHGLDETAQAAVREWKFAPARRNGAPVTVITQVDVDFKLPQPDVFRVGAGVTAPKVVSRVEPKHTPESQALRCYGSVVIESLIKPDGAFDLIRVVRGADYGLTESAIDALKQWKFEPGVRSGKPVSVAVNVEVNFNFGGSAPKTDCNAAVK